MEAFRPPMPGYVHGQLCPVCMTTHFPFCPPRYPPRFVPNHHTQFEAFRPPHPYLGGAQSTPESGFRAPAMAPDPAHRLPPFVHSYATHSVENYRLPPPVHDQFQSVDPRFHAPPHIMSLRGGTSWIDADRTVNFQQYRRLGQDSGEPFFPRPDYYRDERNSMNRLGGPELQADKGQVAQAGIPAPWSQGFSGRQSLPLEGTQNAEMNSFSNSGHSHVNVSDNLDSQLSAHHAAHMQKNAEFQKHGLKRKQPLSREEELLIEKGLLDEDEALVCRASSSKANQLKNQHAQVMGFDEVKISRSPEKLMSNQLDENLSRRNWHVPSTVNSHQPLHTINNNDILKKQYEEWEAEEKKLVALRQTENREIQKQDTGDWHMGGMQPGHFIDKIGENTMNSSHGHGLPQSDFSQLPHQSQQTNYYSSQQSINHCHKHLQSFMQHGNQEHWEHQRGNALQATSVIPQWKESPYPVQLHEGQHYQHAIVTEHAVTLVPQTKEHSINFNNEMGQWIGKTQQQQVHCFEQATYLYKKPIESQNRQSHAHPSVYQANLPETLHLEGHYQSGPIVGPSPPPLPPTMVDPPPPCSPPPPLPASDYPGENIPPLPPPSQDATMLNATGQGFLSNTQYYQVQQQQNLRPCNLSYGGPESLHLQHTALNFSRQVNQASQLQPHAPQQLERSKTVDAVNIFRNPGRITRPERFVVILRGLPGSGKSYLAKALRDVEVMNGGSAPRIHSMDDYFMTEVEKVEEVEMGTSNLKSKKKVVRKVMEYCYEAEMEEAYRASMLKAFRKTLEEGMFKFVIVDDCNVLIADFAQFWAIAKRSGYEAYILEAPYTDVKGCAARNVHNFTEEQVQSMADKWELTPMLYLKLDVSLLIRGDDLNTQDIIEVEMDADDVDDEVEVEDCHSSKEKPFATSQSSENATWGDRWEDTVEESDASPVAKRPLERYSLGSGDIKKSDDDALSGLMTTYGKKDKFVHWSDNEGIVKSKAGFTIGSGLQKQASLIIGPGPGYNGMSNPMILKENEHPEGNLHKNKKFMEQLRDEQETFKAVFARRRQRICAVDEDDED